MLIQCLAIKEWGGDISVAAVVSRDDSIRPRNVPAVDWPALLNLLCVLSSNQNSK